MGSVSSECLLALITRRSSRVRLYYLIILGFVPTLVYFLLFRSRSCALCHKFDLTADKHEDYQCVRMEYTPLTFVCLYDGDVDEVSTKLVTTAVWEHEAVARVQDWLGADPSLGLIDLGAHIGVYSLLAARMGHPVVAVEPHLESLYRLRAAAQLNDVTDRITVLHNAVGDAHSEGRVITNDIHQGQTLINKDDTNVHIRGRPYASIITLDDVTAYCPFREAVLKLDVNGMEHIVFRNASALFEKIRITHVLIEWENLLQYSQQDSLDTFLVHKMILFLTSRKYRATNLERVRLASNWHAWPRWVVFELQTHYTGLLA